MRILVTFHGLFPRSCFMAQELLFKSCFHGKTTPEVKHASGFCAYRGIQAICAPEDCVLYSFCWNIHLCKYRVVTGPLAVDCETRLRLL